MAQKLRDSRFFSANTDSNQYYPQFSTLINYFINNGTGLKRIGDINKFLTEICEGIGGLINLTLLFALMSSVEKGTKTSLFFNFKHKFPLLELYNFEQYPYF